MELKRNENPELHTPTLESFKEIKPEASMMSHEARQYWDDFFQKEITPEQCDCLYTTREDRVKFAEHSDGEWSGEPGNSNFSPTDKTEEGRLASRILRKNDMDGIEFKDGIPDFSPLAVEVVSIDMTSDITENYKNAYGALRDRWNAEAKDGRTDWTKREVMEWKQDNHLSPHECSDMKTVMFIPTDVHDMVKHYGGRAECKARDEAMGGVFDE